jgi:hypothetical protein
MNSDNEFEYWLQSNGYIEEEKNQSITEKISNRMGKIFNPILPKNEIRKKFIISLVLCLIADLVSSFDNYAMTHDWIVTQLFTGLISQGIWTMNSFFIFDAKSKKERVVLFLGTAFGCSLGSTLMLGWFKPLFNSMF